MQAGEIIRQNNRIFPGLSAAVIYLIGCNFRCPYCSFGKFFEARTAPNAWERREVLSRLRDWRASLEGVVFSGGEPTMHGQELIDWIGDVREMGFQVMLETNGSNPEVLRRLFAENLLDYVAMDVKAPRDNYAALCGRRVDPVSIQTSIWLIRDANVPHEFRTTVVPGLHTLRELKSVVDWINGADHFVVQDFVSTDVVAPVLRNRTAFPKAALEKMRPYVEKRIGRFTVRQFSDARESGSYQRRRVRRNWNTPVEI